MQLAALARFRAHRSAQHAWHVLRAHARAVAAPARCAREQSEVACGFAEVQAVQEGRDALGWRARSTPRPIGPAAAEGAAWQRRADGLGLGARGRLPEVSGAVTAGAGRVSTDKWAACCRAPWLLEHHSDQCAGGADIYK